ncbi:peptidoglycan editing factor PgeF [Rhodoplanes sp. TEM]|uniref:Purine nucleoside phosphorylase n=1 Tax=Rhodoplanes tepidamans TaxID=200616 RepID=A0ABT5JHS3_RHOTP|nr:MULTISPECIES: peptidoglycan editing factor PgeF [Rhodoplanes]MDC7789146.1 peptidoglycan editing factor PgeF [Rhodoplanes tepidamans]MDC7987652.1 peptidoglycan editing factor PgeF [Rhodoplanes sp. TEM]MDQ0358516.1 YfiH family protein [Rhodoplanes tepidamans]
MMVTARSLSALPGIRHAFFTREGGVSEGLYASLNAGFGSGDDQARVAENRARMAAAVGVPAENLLSAIQIHSADVIVAETPWTAAQRPKLDAIVTRTPGLAVCASTADCGPVLFADPEARVVGAAHAGWRGALAGVTDSTIAAMETLGADRSRIVAAIGPMIRQPSYEVGPEVKALFVAQDPANARFFAPGREDREMLDVAGYIAARLAAAGLRHIEDVGLCTYADEARFYSYRRTTHRGEPDYGRHVNAIALMG